MRNLLLPLAFLLAACPEQVGQQCPPNTSQVGQFTLLFAPQRVPGECTVATDGGHLTQDNHPSQGATLCVGPGSDGGPQLNLLLAGQPGVNKSGLLADGGFHFQTDPVSATGTGCACDAIDTETLDGFLLTGSADAGFALQPDGGLPLVNALSATLTDHLTANPAPQQTCLCSFPCTVTYLISGNRF